MEMTSLASHAKRYALTDPMKALNLLDLAEELRPDGSPSLTEALPDGHSTIENLRDTIASTIVANADYEAEMTESAVRESTKTNFIDTLTELSALSDSDALTEWEANMMANASTAELTAKYGIYVPDVLNAISQVRTGEQSKGNGIEYAELSEGIRRGIVSWDDVAIDDRIGPSQRQRLFTVIKEQDERAQLGHILDSQLADKLIVNLNEKSPDIADSPDKTRLYQNELHKRLQGIDPGLDVDTANSQRLEIMQGMIDEITTPEPEEPAKPLVSSIQVNSGVPLTVDQIRDFGKAFNRGGMKGVREMYGVDFFQMNGQEQRALLAEIQGQRLEAKARESAGTTNRIGNNYE